MEDHDSYRESEDFVRRRSGGYRQLDDLPAVKEWNDREKARKAEKAAKSKAARLARQAVRQAA